MIEKRKAKRVFNKWTAEHIEILRANYPFKKPAEMEALLPHTRIAICSRAKDLGIRKSGDYKHEPFEKSKRFTQDQLNIIKETYAHTPVDKLMQALPGLTRKDISRIASKMGIKKIAKSAGGPRRACSVNKLFTPEECAIMVNYYPVSTAEQMLKLLPGKRIEQIQKKAQHLKLSKTTEAIQRNNIAANKKRNFKAEIRRKLKVDKPKPVSDRKQDRVLPTKTDHYTGNKIRVNATTEIYAKPGKTAEQVISEYNAAREAAKQRILKGPSKWD